jgi:hypothetical protein
MKLLDPLAADPSEWPAGSEKVRAYAEAFARLGSDQLIANLQTRVRVLVVADQALPVTINETEYENTYVCSPYTAYASYAKEELRLIRSAPARWALGGLADVTGRWLKSARVNQMVQVNNWMLSTNLFPGDVALPFDEIATFLTARYPDHYLCLRSLNAWTNHEAMRRLRGARYKLIASRQVYCYDDVEKTWGVTSNARHDRRLLARTPYHVVSDEALSDADYDRMAELYRLLYIDKYSHYNPVFTARYLRLCRECGAMIFFGLRGSDGTLAGALGLFVVDGVVTAPVVGYDTSADRRVGLYRLLMTLVFEYAGRNNYRINLSSGASGFKRLRGGRGVIEYSAIYDRHLSRARRTMVSGLGVVVNGLGVPLMRTLKL